MCFVFILSLFHQLLAQLVIQEVAVEFEKQQVCHSVDEQLSAYITGLLYVAAVL